MGSDLKGPFDVAVGLKYGDFSFYVCEGIFHFTSVKRNVNILKLFVYLCQLQIVFANSLDPDQAR